LTEQRLIPFEAAGNIGNPDDCPRAFHRLLPRSSARIKRQCGPHEE
jgi:hypothetical protein